MYPSELDFHSRQEQYNDLLRTAERERLIRVAGLPSPNLWQLSGHVANRLTVHSAKWVARPHPSAPVSTATCDPCC